MNRCEGILWDRPRAGEWQIEFPRCGQVVGLSYIRDKDGTPHYYCCSHEADVTIRVDRADGLARGERDRFEELHAMGREAARRAADRSEELRSWGGKWEGWRG